MKYAIQYTSWLDAPEELEGESTADALERANWKTWADSDDAADLLEEFVTAVSSEEIDDVNLFWRVKTEK